MYFLIDLTNHTVLGTFATEEEAQPMAEATEQDHELCAVARVANRYTLPQLAALYNSLPGVVGNAEVKRFSDKVSAGKRILAAVSGPVPTPTEEKPVKTKKVKVKKQPKPRTRLNEEAIVRVTATAARLRYGVQKDGQRGAFIAWLTPKSETTIGKAIAYCEGSLQRTRAQAIGMINKLIARKALQVTGK